MRAKQRSLKKLCELSTEEAKVELDFKWLHILAETRDYTLYLNPNDERLSVDLYAWKFREQINTYMLSKFISEEKENIDTVLDIGSNIGYFPLMELASGA